MSKNRPVTKDCPVFCTKYIGTKGFLKFTGGIIHTSDDGKEFLVGEGTCMPYLFTANFFYSEPLAREAVIEERKKRLISLSKQIKKLEGLIKKEEKITEIEGIDEGMDRPMDVDP